MSSSSALTSRWILLVAADTNYAFLPSVCCESSLQWPAAIFWTQCFLLVVAEDKRGLNIRSISMDFRFESPGECWALWKNSARATKGKTSKHQGEEKKSIPYDLWFKGYAFFSQDTYKKTLLYCNTFVVVVFISDSYIIIIIIIIRCSSSSSSSISHFWTWARQSSLRMSWPRQDQGQRSKRRSDRQKWNVRWCFEDEATVWHLQKGLNEGRLEENGSWRDKVMLSLWWNILNKDHHQFGIWILKYVHWQST